MAQNPQNGGAGRNPGNDGAGNRSANSSVRPDQNQATRKSGQGAGFDDARGAESRYGGSREANRNPDNSSSGQR
jgi:hypothetical protein